MIGHCADQVWRELVHRVAQAPAASPRGKETHEVLANQTMLSMSRCIVTSSGRDLGLRFAAAEAWWIMSGRSELADLGRFARHMAPFSDDGVRLAGAYGPPFSEQVRYVVDSLLWDLDTRQAVASFWRPNPRQSKDVPCTVSLQWLVRNRKLHCCANMRSSDVWLGWPYDVFTFSMLSAYVALELRRGTMDGRSSARTASVDPPDIELGNLWLTAGSQHLYVDPSPPYPGILDALARVRTDVAEHRGYAPLDLDVFASGADLRAHLRSVMDADLESARSIWLVELLG